MITKKDKIKAGFLFDSEESNYQEAASYFNEIEGISIGISRDNKDSKKFINYNLADFSQLFDDISITQKLIDKTSMIPDGVFLSPPCESGSRATSIKGRTGGKGNINGAITPHKYSNNVAFTLQEIGLDSGAVKVDGNIKQQYSRINGELTLLNSGTIIKDLLKINPKLLFCLENPSNYSGTYIKHRIPDLPKMYAQKVYYSAYDLTFSPKREVFASNVKLKLKDEKVLKTGSTVYSATDERGKISKNYGTKSSIPMPLLKDIYSQFLEEWSKNDT